MNFTNRANAKRQTKLSYLGAINNSAKLVKNKKVNNYTYILYLAPANTSGYNVCSHSTPECRLGCLNTSGRVKIETFSNINIIRKARINKTKLFFEDQDFFMNWMVAEMKAYQKKAEFDGFNFSVRLNGTSDIKWENVKLDGKTIFQIFPDTQFYDYTKNWKRYNTKLPKNYHLTFSYTGRNKAKALELLSKGYNVAVVYNVRKSEKFPATWKGYPVINGDLTDYRPLDGNGVVVGLTWKDIANRQANKTLKESCFVEQVKAAIVTQTV